MPTRQDPTRQDPSVLSDVLDQLACPACLGCLQAAADQLSCGQCGRTYPVVDGIPILIADLPGAAAGDKIV